MTQNNNLRTQSTNFIKRPMLIGAGVGLILISFFVFTTRDPRPEWGKLWMIRPLIIVPLAGFLGGAFYYWMAQLSSQKKINRPVTLIFSLIVFMFVLWIGVILGLDGTLWD